MCAYPLSCSCFSTVMRFFRLLFILLRAGGKAAVRYSHLDTKQSKTPLYTLQIGVESTQNMKLSLLLACWYHTKFHRHCKTTSAIFFKNGSDAICSNWLLLCILQSCYSYVKCAQYAKKRAWKLNFVKDVSAHDIWIVTTWPHLVYHWWVTAVFGCHI